MFSTSAIKAELLFAENLLPLVHRNNLVAIASLVTSPLTINTGSWLPFSLFSLVCFLISYATDSRLVEAFPSPCHPALEGFFTSTCVRLRPVLESPTLANRRLFVPGLL